MFTSRSVRMYARMIHLLPRHGVVRVSSLCSPSALLKAVAELDSRGCDRRDYRTLGAAQGLVAALVAC